MMQRPVGGRGRRFRPLAAVAAAGLALVTLPSVPHGQSAARPLKIAATTSAAALDWDRQIGRFLDAGTVRLTKSREDTLLPGRVHDRFDQYYGGVRVFGAQLVRQAEGGRAISVFGSIHPDIALEAVPALTREQAIARAVAATGGESMSFAGSTSETELLVLPRGSAGVGGDDADGQGADGQGAGGDARSYVLAWSVPVATRSDVLRLFVDAQSGAEIARQSRLVRQTAVGNGRGVRGDEKKISVNRVGGAYFADDHHRPPSLVTLDLRGSFQRTIRMLDGFVAPAQSDIATDTDNDWTDGATVDAHVHLGWTYDYYFKRFGRHGLDNRDRPIKAIVHPVSRADVLDYDDEVLDTFYANAFWCGECQGGMIMFGEGVPPNLFNVNIDYLAAALDIVAHELTHGVTEYTSNLIYQGEPGALNEAFSDMMGVSAEFFHTPTRADYLMGEDAFPLAAGWARSIEDPRRFGNPDHYTGRYRGPEDNGGVHINSTIPSHAFYLAIEGGTNRTSGRGVQGVGPGNREQIERVFYRAFASMLPPDASFAVARQATLQAATDLYGSSSPAFRAVSQAWDAVGVF